MRKLLAVAFLFCLTHSVVNAQEEIINLTKPLRCSKPENVFEHFLYYYEETPAWVGKTTNDTHITLLVNKSNRSWTIVEYDSVIACVIAGGNAETSSKPEI
jgi:hypothetical protein